MPPTAPLFADDDAAPWFALNERLVVSGGLSDPPDSRLDPQYTVFATSGEHTVAWQEEKAPPEVTMRYAVSNSTAARFSINSQDRGSPLYMHSGTRDGAINATGMYLDVDVRENVQLQFGGEYRIYEDETVDSAASGGAAGASIGLRWNF